jgi:hypothetical protein
LIVGRPKSTWVFLTSTHTQILVYDRVILFFRERGPKPVCLPFTPLGGALRDWRPSILALQLRPSTLFGKRLSNF